MPQPKGHNGQTPRTKRELTALELIDQTDDHSGVEHTAASWRDMRGLHPTSDAQVIPFPTRTVPPTEPDTTGIPVAA